MEQRSTFWRSAMTYGLYLGISLIVYNVILYIIGKNLDSSLAWITYLIIAAGVIYSQIGYRNRDLGGYISYSTSLGFGVAVMICAGLIQSVYSVILFTYINPNLLDQLRTMQEEAMLQQGVPEDQIETLTDMMTKFRSPVFLAISSLFGFALFGFVISLITSIFVKKTDDGNDAFDEVMEEVKKEE